MLSVKNKIKCNEIVKSKLLGFMNGTNVLKRAVKILMTKKESNVLTHQSLMKM